MKRYVSEFPHFLAQWPSSKNEILPQRFERMFGDLNFQKSKFR